MLAPLAPLFSGLGRPSIRLEFATNDELASYLTAHPSAPLKVVPAPGHARRRALSMLEREIAHAGPRIDLHQAAQPEGQAGVELVPLARIFTDKAAFQNRADDFSQETVDRILADAGAGVFKWANLDAITLWLAPDGRYYIISGHSRYKAFSILAERGASAEGRPFSSIPAKIFTGTKEEAVEMARNSNTLSTKERETERATYYRNLAGTGISRKEVEAQAKQREGKNANYILNLAALSERGDAWVALVAMEDATDVTNAQKIKSLADWIGQARRRWPELTNGHEGELFKWLTEQYGKPGFTKRPDFIERVERAILAAQQAGTFETALNPYGNAYKKPGEIEYDRQLAEATTAWQEAKAELDQKRKRYVDEGLSLERLNTILEPYEHQEKVLLLKLEAERHRAGRVKHDASRELSLFGLDKNFDFVSWDIMANVDGKLYAMTLGHLAIWVSQGEKTYYAAQRSAKLFNFKGGIYSGDKRIKQFKSLKPALHFIKKDLSPDMQDALDQWVEKKKAGNLSGLPDSTDASRELSLFGTGKGAEIVYMLPEEKLTLGQVNSILTLPHDVKAVFPQIKVSYRRPKALSDKSLKCSNDSAEFLRSVMPKGEIDLKEHFICLYISHQNEVIGYYYAAAGAKSSVTVDTAQLIAVALQSNATGMILCHNHPSGGLRPSEADKILTATAIKAAKLFNINILDHVIVTSDGHFSFADRGLL